MAGVPALVSETKFYRAEERPRDVTEGLRLLVRRMPGERRLERGNLARVGQARERGEIHFFRHGLGVRQRGSAVRESASPAADDAAVFEVQRLLRRREKIGL